MGQLNDQVCGNLFEQQDVHSYKELMWETDKGRTEEETSLSLFSSHSFIFGCGNQLVSSSVRAALSRKMQSAGRDAEGACRCPGRQRHVNGHKMSGLAQVTV